MKDIEKFAQEMDAKVVGGVPDCGGGAFGAARLAAAVSSLKGRNTVGKHDFFEVCMVFRSEGDLSDSSTLVAASTRGLFAAHGASTILM